MHETSPQFNLEQAVDQMATQPTPPELLLTEWVGNDAGQKVAAQSMQEYLATRPSGEIVRGENKGMVRDPATGELVDPAIYHDQLREDQFNQSTATTGYDSMSQDELRTKLTEAKDINDRTAVNDIYGSMSLSSLAKEYAQADLDEDQSAKELIGGILGDRVESLARDSKTDNTSEEMVEQATHNIGRRLEKIMNDYRVEAGAQPKPTPEIPVTPDVEPILPTDIPFEPTPNAETDPPVDIPFEPTPAEDEVTGFGPTGRPRTRLQELLDWQTSPILKLDKDPQMIEMNKVLDEARAKYLDVAAARRGRSKYSVEDENAAREAYIEARDSAGMWAGKLFAEAGSTEEATRNWGVEAAGDEIETLIDGIADRRKARLFHIRFRGLRKYKLLGNQNNARIDKDALKEHEAGVELINDYEGPDNNETIETGELTDIIDGAAARAETLKARRRTAALAVGILALAGTFTLAKVA